MNFAGKKKTVGNWEMEREGVSHISIPYRMTPPTSPLSPRGWVAQKKALRCWPIFQPARGVIASQGSTTSTTIAHSIYTPIVHSSNTPIAIILEMFGLPRLHPQSPNISEKTNATKILFCGVHYFPAFLPLGSSPPNWILIFVGLAVPTSLSV